jgi:hypothetical protein
MTPFVIKNFLTKDYSDFLFREVDILRDCFSVMNSTNSDNTKFYYGLLCAEASLLHCQKILERHLNVSLHPTYSLVQYSLTGAKLNEIKGRSSNEFTVIIELNNESWPIVINNVTHTLSKGDALVFSGITDTYSRNEYVGKKRIDLILNYVDANGDLSHLKWDTKNNLGAWISSAAPIVHAEQTSLNYKIS